MMDADKQSCAVALRADCFRLNLFFPTAGASKAKTIQESANSVASRARQRFILRNYTGPLAPSARAGRDEIRRQG